MSRVDEYCAKLQKLQDWTPFLLKNSGLPGPRGNLELAQAVSELADGHRIESWLSTAAKEAPENSPEVFLVFCGITALGKVAARGDLAQLARLRSFASDPRWRVREAVAVAVQYIGDANMPAVLKEMKAWSTGNAYEQRAAAAGLCEPRLLKLRTSAQAVLRILDRITEGIAAHALPRDDAFKVLRQAMGYCWSVAVAAAPEAGKPMMEKWLSSSDTDIRWIMKENLKKNRLIKLDAAWVRSCLAAL